MKISYRREMKHNYLIIEQETEILENYEVRMLQNNTIEGLLKFRTKRQDSKLYFYYEITSRQPLCRLLENRCISSDEIRQLLLDITRSLDRMEEYLLKEGQILLDPEYIYVKPDTGQVSLCLVPGICRDFPDDFRKLLQYLLKKVDHQDKDAVVLAYGLYQESLMDNYGMEDLLKLLRGQKQEEGGGEQEIENVEIRNQEPENQATRNSATRNQASRNSATRNQATKKPDPKNLAKEIKHSEQKFEDTYFEEQVCPVPVKKGTGLIQLIILQVFAIIGLPIAVWLLQGGEGLSSNRGWIALGEGVLLLSIFLSLSAYVRHLFWPEKDAQESNNAFWQMEFIDEIEQEGNQIKEQDFDGNSASKLCQTAQDHTMLLSEEDQGERGAVHRLCSLDRSMEDIPISYYPFIIGKQENMVDYLIQKETVSRLHIRIDQTEDGHQITDLNSTNGTTVRGQQLETNGMTFIQTGDELYIADLGFRFS